MTRLMPYLLMIGFCVALTLFLSYIISSGQTPDDRTPIVRDKNRYINKYNHNFKLLSETYRIHTTLFTKYHTCEGRMRVHFSLDCKSNCKEEFNNVMEIIRNEYNFN